MLLDSDRYEAVINYGKDAINKLNENELERIMTHCIYLTLKLII